ncbi:MAG: iron-containing alcohol dehydrogenase [Alphaproteobacteria bacterium]|nr:iron-containing alcohol dehydrogenase [Alphaproteobacteria bacterium]
MTSTLERLLAGAFPDPDGGAPLAAPACTVVIAPSLAGREAELVAGAGLVPPFAVVADPDTQAVLGARVGKALAPVIAVTLDRHPHADGATVARLREATRAAATLVAVGSGTVNDLCKYSAKLDGKPYAVFATAPSMNGFTSVNAAITLDGHKKTLPAAAARGVFIDLAIMAAAPARMIRAGLGDSICRATAQADWLLAHLLLDTPYRAAPFALLTEDEAVLVAHPEALLAGDLGAMERLARILVLSGFGMTLCGGSYPASQGEHLISHYAEMLAPEGPETLHGEQIGVTAITMARLQEGLLAGPPPTLFPTATDEAAVIAHFGPDLGPACWAEFRHKRLDPARCRTVQARLADRWDEVRDRIRRISRPSAEIRDVLARAGAPTAPRDIGWSDGFYRAAVTHAREIRNRYTFLDLAADAGRLDEAF